MVEHQKGVWKMAYQEQKRRWRSALLCVASLLCVLSAPGCGRSAQDADAYMWGRVDAKEIDVNSKIAGRVVELLVQEGDVVRAGDLLARIDQRDLLTQKAQIEADIAAIEAQQVQAQALTSMQDGQTAASLQEMQAAVYKAEADLALAEADHRRYQALLESGAVSRQAYEQYATKYEVAQASAGQARAFLRQAQASRRQNDVNRANENVVQKKLDQAYAKLAQLEVSLSETEIRAPFDGLITKKYVEVGQMISTGTPLVSIQDPEDNWMDLKVPETAISRFSLQQCAFLRTIILYPVPAFILSGYTWPPASMPEGIQAIAQLFPLTHLSNTLRELFLMGASPHFAESLRFLTILAALYGGLGARLYSAAWKKHRDISASSI